ncbi:unnamed protein product [Psylliodes chrysocephalus]|uniref:Uncharacterized protein n=1 Tax=Psylliodes chrysocephalus TaxID=3402493 RepID=A0A9P0CXT4_9CUCU|nr:unnamed protein product [Psylliodes chrysocephala]
MKLIICMFIFAFFSFANANENKEVELLDEVDKKLINEIITFAQGLRIDEVAGITAEINEYIDRLFPNISNYCISHSLDPAPLDDVKEKFLLAKINFVKGFLHGISNLVRYGDVTVGYQSKIKTLTLTLPVEFSNLSFTYDYTIKVLGIGPSGDLIGKVDNFKFYLQLSFNLNTLTAQIDNLKTTDSGCSFGNWSNCCRRKV